MVYTYEHNGYTYKFDDRSCEFLIAGHGRIEMKTLVSAVKFNLHDNRIKNIEHGLNLIISMVPSHHKEPINKIIDMCKEERR